MKSKSIELKTVGGIRGELEELGVDLDFVNVLICLIVEFDCLIGKVGDGDDEDVDERGDEGEEDEGDTDAEEEDEEDDSDETITNPLLFDTLLSRLFQPSYQ